MSFWLGENSYATVWNVENKGNYVNGRISTSKKKQDGTYENSNWFARCIGKCKDQSLTLVEKDRITIKQAKIENKSYVGKDGERKNSLNVLIFDFEMSENQGNKNYESPVPEQQEDDVLPFN